MAGLCKPIIAPVQPQGRPRPPSPLCKAEQGRGLSGPLVWVSQAWREFGSPGKAHLGCSSRISPSPASFTVAKVGGCRGEDLTPRKKNPQVRGWVVRGGDALSVVREGRGNSRAAPRQELAVGILAERDQRWIPPCRGQGCHPRPGEQRCPSRGHTCRARARRARIRGSVSSRV